MPRRDDNVQYEDWRCQWQNWANVEGVGPNREHQGSDTSDGKFHRHSLSPERTLQFHLRAHSLQYSCIKFCHLGKRNGSGYRKRCLKSRWGYSFCAAIEGSSRRDRKGTCRLHDGPGLDEGASKGLRESHHRAARTTRSSNGRLVRRYEQEAGQVRRWRQRACNR